MIRSRAPSQSGLTLIELMISMVIAGIVVAFLLGIHARLSSGYRASEKVAQVEQTLLLLRQELAREARSAGNRFGLLPGVDCSTPPQAKAGCGLAVPIASAGDPPNYRQAIEVDNAALGDTFDQLTFFYADDSFALPLDSFPVAGQVVTYSPAIPAATVADELEIGDRVVLVSPVFEDHDSNEATPDRVYSAICAAEITDIATAMQTIQFASSAALNSIDLDHCQDVKTRFDPQRSRLYRLVGRSYRIDPGNRQLSPLHVSPSGGLIADDWEIMAIGITTLQIAVQVFESADPSDEDGDGDPERDWYSSDNQEALKVGAVPIRLGLSLEARSPHAIHGAAPQATPEHDGVDLDHNDRGDLPATTLEGVADASRPVQYRGDHVYRALHTRIDLRNLGVGL